MNDVMFSFLRLHRLTLTAKHRLFLSLLFKVLMPSAAHTLEVPVTPLGGLTDVMVYVTVVFPDTEVPIFLLLGWIRAVRRGKYGEP